MSEPPNDPPPPVVKLVPPMAQTGFKVVELATVTDESLEETLNQWTARGFVLEGIHFAMRESSKRPSMAFVVFSRPKS